MGNVIDTTADKVSDQPDDSKWLSIPLENIFDNEFVNTIELSRQSLPELQKLEPSDNFSTEENQSSHVENLTKESWCYLSQRYFAELHSAPQPKILTDFNDLRLFSCHDLESSTFAHINSKRYQILIRIHDSYVRLHVVRQASNVSSALLDFRSSIAQKKTESSILLNTSISMSLSLLESLGPSHPLLFHKLSCSLITLLNTMDTFEALTSCKYSTDASARQDGLQAISTFSKDCVLNNNGNRQDALSLLLATSVCSGSLGDLLSCIYYLLCGPEVLGPAAQISIATLSNISPSFELPLPQVNNISDIFVVHLEDKDISKEEECASKVQDDRSPFCTDGAYIFMFQQGSNLSLLKIGSGFHNTIPGRIYLASSCVEYQLKVMLGKDVYTHDIAHDTSSVLSDSPYCHPGCAASRPFPPSSSSVASLTCRVCEGKYHSCFGAYGRRGSHGWISGPCEAPDECPESPNDQFCSQPCEDYGAQRGGMSSGTPKADLVHKQGWVSCLNGRLYLRMNYLLGPMRLAVFSCNTLVLEEVVEVLFPFPLDVVEEEWQYNDNVINVLQSSTSYPTACAYLTAWDPELSDPDLTFSDDYSTCHRLQGVSCNPTSLISISQPSVAMRCILPEKKRSLNRMSIGIARKGFSKNGACRAFGLGESSWGLYEDISNDSNVMCINACGVRAHRGVVGGLKAGDVIIMRYECAAGKAWLFVDRTGGDFSNPVVQQEFTLHSPGKAKKDEYVMGAIYADGYGLQLTVGPLPYISDVDKSPTPILEDRSKVIFASSNFSSLYTSPDYPTNNLIADDASWKSNVTFTFDAADVEKTITIRLEECCNVVNVGSLFCGDDKDDQNEGFQVYLSHDGINFVEFVGIMQRNCDEINSMVFVTKSNRDNELLTRHDVDFNVRYVRIQYSRHVCHIRRIVVYGRIRKKLSTAVSMLPMSCDGLHLIFFHLDTSNYVSKEFVILKSFSVDPKISMSVIAEKDYIICDFPSKMLKHYKNKFLLECSFACNGYNLIISFPLGHEEPEAKSTSCGFLRLDCKEGVRCATKSYVTSTFSREAGYPSSLCYDSFNNMVWGCCSQALKLIRWRNDHLSRRLATSQPSSDSDLFLNTFPQHRLDAFSAKNNLHTNHNVQAAYLLTLLDKISFSYSCPNIVAAECEMLNTIQVSSGWNCDRYFCKWLIRGQNFDQCSDGFNFIVLDKNFYPQSFKNFEINGSTNDMVAEAMIKYINEIPVGFVVLAAIHNDSSQSLSSTILVALRSIGAKCTSLDSLTRFFAYALIGIKQKSENPTSYDSMQQVSSSLKANITMEQIIPPIYTPLCFECKHLTFSILVQMINLKWRAFYEESHDSVNVSILISAVNILTTNTIQLLASMSLHEARKIFNLADRNCIDVIVNQIISVVEHMVVRGSEVGCYYSVILSMFLRLNIISADLNFTSPEQKFLTLFHYFKKVILRKLGANIDDFVLKLLLRIFSPNFFSKCLLFNGEVANRCARRPFDSVSFIPLLLTIGENEIKRNFQYFSTASTTNICSATNFPPNYSNAIQECLGTMCQVLVSAALQKLATLYQHSNSSCSIPHITAATQTISAIECIMAIFHAILNSSCNVLAWGHKFLKACDDDQRQAILQLYQSSCLKLLLPLMLSWISLILKYNSDEIFLQVITPAILSTMKKICRLLYQMKHNFIPAAFSASFSKINENDLDTSWKMQSHWFGNLEDQMNHCFSLVGVRLVSGTPWVKQLENKAHFWLSNPLFAHGFSEDESFTTTTYEPVSPTKIVEDELLRCEKARFLLDFLDRPTGSLAATLCALMKKHVSEDQGSYAEANRVVYLSCAVQIKHHNCVNEAISLAKQYAKGDVKGIGAENVFPSQQLCTIWKQTQELRSFVFLHAGNVSDMQNDDEVVDNTCRRVIERAQFLLRLHRYDLSAGVERMQCCHTTTPSSKLNNAKIRNPTPGAIWNQAVVEVMSASEDFSSTTILPQDTSPSLSKHILNFLKSEADVTTILKANAVRSLRAKRRAQGIELLSAMIEYPSPSLFWVSWITSSFRHALHTTAPGRPVTSAVLHVFNAIEGCSAQTKTLVINSFCGYLNNCLNLLSHAIRNCNQCDKKEQWCSIALCCLKSLCLDYNVCDFVWLYESNILSCLYSSLNCIDEVVRTTTMQVIEVMVSQIPVHGTLPPIALSFSRELIALTIAATKNATFLVSQRSRSTPGHKSHLLASCGDCSTLSPHFGSLKRRGMQVLPDSPVTSIRRENLGLQIPHLNIGSKNTIAMWIKRPRCSARNCRQSFDDFVDLFSTAAYTQPCFNQGLWSTEDKGEPGTDKRGENNTVGNKAVTATINQTENDTPFVPANVVGLEMGFRRDNAVAALREFGGNFDATVEILTETNLGSYLFGKDSNSWSNECGDENKGVPFPHDVIYNELDKLRVCDINTLQNFAQKVVGMTVVRGPDWEKRNKEYDTKMENFRGTVLSFDAAVMTLQVQWSNAQSSVTSWHLYGALVQGRTVYEVTVGDRSLLGHIYSFCSRDHFQSSKIHSQTRNTFGLLLDEDARLKLFSSGHDNPYCTAKSTSRIPPDVWTHVCVVYDGVKTSLYINGNLDVEHNHIQFGTSSVQTDIPLYIGQTPLIVPNYCLVPSFEGTMGEMTIFGGVDLTRGEVQMSATCRPPSTATLFNEDFCMQILSLLYKHSVCFLLFTSMMKTDYIRNNFIGPLMSLLSHASPNLCYGASRVCTELLPAYSVEMVDSAINATLLDNSCSFVEFLLKQIGNLMDIFSQFPTPHSSESFSHHGLAVLCAETDCTLLMGFLNLLMGLQASPIWNKDVSSYLHFISSTFASQCVSSLESFGRKSASSRRSLSLAQFLEDQDEIKAFQGLLTILGLCRGSIPGIYPGSNARYNGGDGFMAEDCLILSSAWPPTGKDFSIILKNEIDGTNIIKCQALWNNLNLFGDACYVTMASSPTLPLLVPRSSLTPLDTITKKNAQTEQSFEHLSVLLLPLLKRILRLPSSWAPHPLIEHLKLLSIRALHYFAKQVPWKIKSCSLIFSTLLETATIPIPTLTYFPSSSINPIVLETNHPYGNNVSDYLPVCIPGATTLRVTFDPESSSQRGLDFLTFFKDDSHTSYWGSKPKFSGGHGVWPGTGSSPALVIPSNSFVLHWNTSHSGKSWGWKLTISVESNADVGNDNNDNVRKTNVMNPNLCMYQLQHLHMIWQDKRKSGVAETISIENPEQGDGEEVQHFKCKDISNVIDDLISYGSKEKLDSLIGRDSPPHFRAERRRTFQVNTTEVSSIVLYRKPGVSSEKLHTVLAGDIMLLSKEQEDDWLNVTVCKSHADAFQCHITNNYDFFPSGWILSRLNDVEYVLPCSEIGVIATSAEVQLNLNRIMSIQSNDIPNSNKRYKTLNAVHSARKEKHINYLVEDRSSTFNTLLCCRNVLSSLPAPIDIWSNFQSSLLPSISSLSRMLYISISQDCIVDILSALISQGNVPKFGKNEPVNIHAMEATNLFDTHEKLLQYLNAVYNQHLTLHENNGVCKAAIYNIFQKFFSDSTRFGPLWNTIAHSAVEQLCLVTILERGLSSSLGHAVTLLLRYDNNNSLNDISDPFQSLYSTVISGEVKEGKDEVIRNFYSGKTRWLLHIPGAQFLKVVPESSTFAAWPACVTSITCVDTFGHLQTLWTKERGGFMKCCYVKGDCCIISLSHGDESFVKFHQYDSAKLVPIPNTFVGTFVTCYGQISGPSYAMRLVFDTVSRELENKQHLHSISVELACWILEFAVTITFPLIQEYLYSQETICCLREYIEVIPLVDSSATIVPLITTMFSRMHIPDSILSEDCLTEITHLALDIAHLCNNQLNNEGNFTGTFTGNRMTLSVVEMCVVINDWLAIMENRSDRIVWDPLRIGCGLEIRGHKLQIAAVSAYPYATAVTQQSVFKSELRTFHVQVSAVLARSSLGDALSSKCEASLGLTNIPHAQKWCAYFLNALLGDNSSGKLIVPGSFSVGWHNRTLRVLYPSRDESDSVVMTTATVPFGPQIRNGDVISVQIDWKRQVVSYYRNLVLVGLAVGNHKSEAMVKIDWELLLYPLFFAVSLNTEKQESVCLLQSFPPTAYSTSHIPLPRIYPTLQQKYTSPWFRSMQNVVQILHSAVTRTIPPVVLSKEFVPMCEQALKITLSSRSAEKSFTQDVTFKCADMLRVAFVHSNLLSSKETVRITAQNRSYTYDKSEKYMHKSGWKQNQSLSEMSVIFEQNGACIQTDKSLLSIFLPELVIQLTRCFWHPTCAAAKMASTNVSCPGICSLEIRKTSTLLRCAACCGQYLPQTNETFNTANNKNMTKAQDIYRVEQEERCPCTGKHIGFDCHGAEGCALKCTIPGRHKPGALVLCKNIISNHHTCKLQKADCRRRASRKCNVCKNSSRSCTYCCIECNFDLCDYCYNGEFISQDVKGESGSCLEVATEITDPPVGGGIVIALEESCLSSKSDTSLHNLLDYSSYLSSYWEANNNDHNNEVIVHLMDAHIEALGMAYRIEFFTTKYGNSYDPDEVTVSGGSSPDIIREVSFSTPGTNTGWVTIASSRQFEETLGDTERISPFVVIKFSSKKSGGCNFRAAGIRFVSEGYAKFCSDLCKQHGDSNVTAEAFSLISGPLIVGDKVMRGPCWRYGNQDGGIGSFGSVVNVTSWQGQMWAGVRVQWENDQKFVGLYRWGFNGLFDLIAVRNHPAREGEKETNLRVINVPGQSLQFTYDYDSLSEKKEESAEATIVLKAKGDNRKVNVSENSSNLYETWKGSPYFNGETSVIPLPRNNHFEFTGDFTIEVWIRIPSCVATKKKQLPIISRKLLRGREKVDQFCLSLSLVEGEGEVRGVESDAEEKGSTNMPQSPQCPNRHTMSIVHPSKHMLSPTNGEAGSETQCCACQSSIYLLCHSNYYYCSRCAYYLCAACGVFASTAAHEVRVQSTTLMAALEFYASDLDLKTSLHLSTRGYIPLDAWTHVALIISGNTAIIYINGQQKATGNFAGPRTGSLGADCLVGTTSNGSECFQGHMFGFRIWDKSVAVEKLRSDWMRSLRGAPGLVAELCCDSELPMFCVDVAWDDAVEATWGSVSNHRDEEKYDISEGRCENDKEGEHGARFYCVITPKISLKTALEEETFAEMLLDYKEQYTSSELKHDRALVRFINNLTYVTAYCSNQGGSSTKRSSCKSEPSVSLDFLLQCEWQTIRPSEDTLQSHVLLSELYHMRETSQCMEATLIARLKILQCLNKELLSVLPLFDLTSSNKPGSLANLLCSRRDLIFLKTKEFFWSQALSATKQIAHTKFDVQISRSRAAKHKQTRLPDDEGSWTVFSQLFRKIHPMPPKKLRHHGQIFKVIFKGEHANDYGGPYSESLAMIALELQSPSLSLLIQSSHSDKWLLNPGAVSTIHIEMFIFLGKLLGIAIRTKEYLALNLSSIVWKLLVSDLPLREDLEANNLGNVQALDTMRHIERQGIFNQDGFATVFFETFTVLSTDHRLIELIPGGATTPVTFDNRRQFCDLVEEYHLHEFDKQVAAVRSGLASIVPVHLLSIFAWDQLEQMVCGVNIMDIALLRSMTLYSGCTESDPHIQFFWTLMEKEFTEDDKSAFLRFVWGRSRLPLNKKDFPRKFKIQAFGMKKGGLLTVDEFLPVSHTCFLSLELPRYTSLEVMRNKLKYAIHNCQAIDGDGDSTGNSAAALGWET